MPEESIIRYIIETFAGVYTTADSGNIFFMYDPEGKFPFATLVTSDDYDQFSDLSRSGVYRLNIGINKETFRSYFPNQSNPDDKGNSPAPPHDFTALNTLMPHPVYGRMYWVSILNPDMEIFQSLVRPLLAEAYKRDMKKHTRHATQP